MPRFLLVAAVAPRRRSPCRRSRRRHHPPGWPHTPQDPAAGHTGQTNLLSVEGHEVRLRPGPQRADQVDGVPTCMPIDAYTVSCSAVHRVELDLAGGPDVANSARPAGRARGRRRQRPLREHGDRRAVARGLRRRHRPRHRQLRLSDAGVEVSVDLEEGDGRSGDDDRIPRDVERVIGSSFDECSRAAIARSSWTGTTATTGSPAAAPLSGARAAAETTGSTPVTAPRTASTAATGCSTGRGRPRAEASLARCAEVGDAGPLTL